MTSASCVPPTASPISSLKYGKCQLPTMGSTTPSSAANRLPVIVAIASLHAPSRFLALPSCDGTGAPDSSEGNSGMRNPQLERLDGLVGEWNLTLSDAW